MSSSSSASETLPPNPLRQDAGVIGLVGGAHLISHFSQLLLAPLFPWLKDAFQVGYTELGFLMTLFFVVSCAVQASAGFLVDRHGPRPILLGGLTLLGIAAFGMAASPSYGVMVGWVVVAGVGNGVFHPVDYTLLNRKVSAARIGHAYSVHGVTGSLGWALAPALLVPLTMAFSWRVALAAAGVLAFVVLAVLWVNRERLQLPPVPVRSAADGTAGNFAFLRIPAVWMCFWFFLLWAIILTAVQAYAPHAARYLHGVPVGLAAMCVTVYMVCSAGGMIVGGFLAKDPSRCERIVGMAFGFAALVALVLGFASLPVLAVPVLFGLMGLAGGLAGPSRDLLVKRSTPENSSGRVYGVVYSGLDIGQAAAPLAFGLLMDHQQYQAVWLSLVAVQLLLITSAFQMRKVPRAAPLPA
ncbi:MFS transporter [Ramlibacter rhizophilus]|uniref:MFS transporter n=1 Tax=Ramlibacter rhizophilus TaxID=1781167 RepID=A0A4Z0BKX3_9BURK|nr:MFS transporter [Ramlibacter rhizophilus]TFY98548.1 MFS transporter [Ramlibacter rhizophilus]